MNVLEGKRVRALLHDFNTYFRIEPMTILGSRVCYANYSTDRSRLTLDLITMPDPTSTATTLYIDMKTINGVDTIRDLVYMTGRMISYKHSTDSIKIHEPARTILDACDDDYNRYGWVHRDICDVRRLGIYLTNLRFTPTGRLRKMD
jgi:hypothetical protein